MSETEKALHSYRVNVSSGNFSGILNAYLEPALEKDMPFRGSHNWSCNWYNLWQKADFNCEAIIKLSYEGRILGLVKFGLYPYPFHGNSPEYLEILNIECISRSKRQINPVGFWLLWYSIKVGLDYCEVESDETLVQLDSLENAIPYYRDKVKMEGLIWKHIAPGEEGYAFRFTKEKAKQFCSRIEREYGMPIPFN
jgi:hypothetical protein